MLCIKKLKVINKSVRFIVCLICLQQNVDDNIQLGPGGRSGYGGWVHGSSGGGKTPSQEGEQDIEVCTSFSDLSQCVVYVA